MLFIKYILLFILGGIIGWLIEYTLFKKKSCDRTLSSITGECYPFLILYGLGMIILYYIHATININIFLKGLIATVIFTVLECFSGMISTYIYNYRTWEYNNLPFCNGYNSIPVSMMWFIMSIFLFKIFEIYEI